MKDFKFRVWTGNKMEYDIVVGKLGAFWVRELNPMDKSSLSNFNTIYPQECPVMQYTGLKDKNGKEIYEGDVVKILYTDWGSEDNYLVGNIVYKTPEFMIDLGIGKYGDTEFGTMNPGAHGWIEIIGNIFENPELVQ